MAKEKESKGLNKAQALMDRILKSSTIKETSRLEDSEILKDQPPIKTNYPMMNIALSGKVLEGGISPGIIQFCGESRTFKTSFMLLLVSEYLRSKPNAVFIFLDNEFGTRESYFDMFNIPKDRVIHIPFQSIESLKFELVKQLDELSEDDEVIIGVDSLGLSSSIKELNDSQEQKSVQDLSRPKALKSLFRIITPKIALKKVPAIFINHFYFSIGGYIATEVLGGGQGSLLASNSVFITKKQKLKDGENHIGYKFLLKVFKSRSIKDNVVIPFTIKWNGTVAKYSGLDVIASTFGIIEKVKDARRNAYQYESLSGNILKVLEKDVDDAEEFWETIFKETDFVYRLENLYRLGIKSTDKLDLEEDDSTTAQLLEEE